ncbi:MAG TPA: hypothetical protein VMV31_06410 [Terriglobales bacterium]|nr:hypothetical protein [Terriglobales bacterium]
MAECPICGLGERCRNHWVATQEAQGEVEFQIGAMTASEDNLILLRNKLNNPPLRLLFEKIALAPEWVEEQGRTLAYLAWPLELRGAVHRTLFPQGAPGAPIRPLPPTPIHTHLLEDLRLEGVELDCVNCLPDELLYKAHFAARLAGVGVVPFTYLQVVWASGVEWAPQLEAPAVRQQAQALVQLLMAGLLDPLRATFAGQQVQVLAEEQPDGLAPGQPVDEIALPGPPEKHLGEEIEAMLNQRRLQPLLRDSLLQLARTPAPAVH